MPECDVDYTLLQFAVTLTMLAESSAKVTTFTEALQKLDEEKGTSCMITN